MMLKMKTMSVAIALALSAGAANAAVYSSTGNNFTMLGGGASTTNSAPLTGGNNTTDFTWDGTFRTSVVTDGSSNATLSSVTPFSGYIWTAHNVNIYGPGTYVFDTTGTTGNPVGTGAATQKYTLVVPTGYVGGHMLFDWSINANIDVVQLWKMNDSWAATDVATTNGPSGYADDPFCAAGPTSYWTNGNCNNGLAGNLNPNPNGNTANTIFSWVSIDTPASTSGSTAYTETNKFHGTKMIDGPFAGQSANFNLQVAAVPVPAAAWLLGSGLLGLVGVARRRKAS